MRPKIGRLIKVEGVDFFAKVELGLVFICLVREYCQKYELGNIIIYFFKIPIVETAPQGRMEEKSHRTFWRNGPQEVPSDDARESFPGVSSGNTLLLGPAHDRPCLFPQQGRGESP